ncbi:MAG: glycosyl transferase family 1 [Porphyromonadaceae bacterium]|nr:glycosyl transferase family 1 [Porphyromonadaceae bacterium]
MKNLLIISDAFPPTFAPRIEAVAKYLPLYGWQPTVITICTREANYTHTATDSLTKDPCPVYRLLKSDAEAGKLRHLLSFLGELLSESREKHLEQEILSLSLPRFDAILCFAYRKFPFRTAFHLAKRWGIPWIADCRDIVEQYTEGDFLPKKLILGGIRFKFVEKWIKHKILKARNASISQACAVITVSSWHCKVLSKINPNVHLIYNGYDPQIFEVCHNSHKRFKIVYTGRLLSLEMRDPTLLFEALRSDRLAWLLKEGLIDVDWYTDQHSKELLEPLIKKYHLERFCHFYAMVPREQMAKIICDADILLQLSNRETSEGPHGMVSTKIFEALAVEKPVLLVRSDESVVESLIRKYNLGCAARCVDDVVGFVLARYKEWSDKGYTEISLPLETKKLFSRKEQVADFARILDKLM